MGRQRKIEAALASCLRETIRYLQGGFGFAFTGRCFENQDGWAFEVLRELVDLGL